MSLPPNPMSGKRSRPTEMATLNSVDRIPVWQWGLVVAVVAIGVYANSIPNGFAYDDPSIVEHNPIVTEGRVLDALMAPYWPTALAGAGLYRPVTVASFAVEWSLWGNTPQAFHAVNVALHALVSVLLFGLLLRWVGILPALLGAVIFAVHPVHTEAVANVVGRGELLAAGFVLTAVWLHEAAPGGGRMRWLRWAALAALYALGLGSKEIAVTLPGVLILVACAEHGMRAGVERERRQWPLYLVFTAVLAGYLVVRVWVLGSLTGEVPAPYLDGLSGGQRVLTAVSVWVQYARLMLFPLDLAADYGPAVLIPARTFDLDVFAGAGVGFLAVWVAIRSRRVAPLIGFGLAWFALVALPISNVLFPIGVLLAERTLYLPSVAVAIMAAGVLEWTRRVHPIRIPIALAGVVVIVLAMTLRTVERNPSWMSTFAMLGTLANEHPESFLAVRARATGLESVGEIAEAARLYELAIEMTPTAYAVVLEVGRFHNEHGNTGRAAELFQQAVQTFPHSPAAWQEWSELLLLQGKGREAHRVALEGLRHTEPDRELWMIVSEAYVAKGDFPAAVRARLAALGAEPETSENWIRLAEIHRMDGDEESALAAEARALGVTDDDPEPAPETHPLGVRGS